MEQEISNESVEISSPQEIDTQSDSLASDLASDLYPDSQRTQPEEVEDAEAEVTEEEAQESETETEEKPEEVVTRTPPKSWTKEMQAKYASLPPEIQDYVITREKQMAEGLEKDRSDANLGRVMRDTMTPYRAMLQAQGVNEAQAVQSLMNVHYKLTNLPMSEKTTYLANIAKSYGIDLSSLPQAEQQEQIDPTIKRLQDELNGIKQTLTSSQQAAINQAHERVAKDVEAFASDSSHPYFDEVADDIAAMIQVGHDLETAYEKAVWANPVTRQKEIARLQTEQEATLREKAKAAADTARKAASLNVKTRDTSKAPTGPRATMRNLDSALEESMREIKSRTH